MAKYIKLEDLMKFPIRLNHYDKEHGSKDFIYGIETVLEYAENLQTTEKGDEQMSERQEKKRRYNQNLAYIADFNRWLNEEPPILKFVSWHKWKKTRPKRRTE